MSGNSKIEEHITKHGDGVKVIALWVDNATKAWKETTQRGAKSYMKPETIEDENGVVIRSGIHTYGDTVHVFVERKITMASFFLDLKKWSHPIIQNQSD